MKYIEYRKASIRHLKTCYFLIDKIKKDNKLPSSEKNLIIINIYYLAGYAIESIINYGIYDYIGFDKKKSVKELKQNTDYTKNYDVCFYRGNTNSRFILQNHDFQNNKDFFARHNISGISNIPFIGYEPDDVKIKNFFYNWDTELRYTTEIKKDKKKKKEINVEKILLSDVEKFVDIAFRIYMGVIQIITK